MRLANDGTAGLAEAIRARTGNSLNNFKGIDSEADAATNIINNQNRNTTRLDRDIENSEGETDIDIDLEDGTAIEVKKKEEYPDTEIRLKNINELDSI